MSTQEEQLAGAGSDGHTRTYYTYDSNKELVAVWCLHWPWPAETGDDGVPKVDVTYDCSPGHPDQGEGWQDGRVRGPAGAVVAVGPQPPDQGPGAGDRMGQAGR